MKILIAFLLICSFAQAQDSVIRFRFLPDKDTPLIIDTMIKCDTSYLIQQYNEKDSSIIISTSHLNSVSNFPPGKKYSNYVNTKKKEIKMDDCPVGYHLVKDAPKHFSCELDGAGDSFKKNGRWYSYPNGALTLDPLNEDTAAFELYSSSSGGGDPLPDTPFSLKGWTYPNYIHKWNFEPKESQYPKSKKVGIFFAGLTLGIILGMIILYVVIIYSAAKKLD